MILVLAKAWLASLLSYIYTVTIYILYYIYMFSTWHENKMDSCEEIPPRIICRVWVSSK